MFLSNRLLKGFPLVFSPELGRSWTTWGDRRDWRSSITITRACAGCTSLSPGILLGRRCRHHLQRFLGILGRLWGGPRGAGVTFSPTENLIVPRALTISTPGTYWLRTAHCYHFMSLCISFQVLNQITLILFEHCFTLFNITWQPVTFSLHNGHCLEYCNIYIYLQHYQLDVFWWDSCCIKLLLLQSKHFLLLQLHIETTWLVKHKLTFIITSSHEMQCFYL